MHCTVNAYILSYNIASRAIHWLASRGRKITANGSSFEISYNHLSISMHTSNIILSNINKLTLSIWFGTYSNPLNLNYICMKFVSFYVLCWNVLFSIVTSHHGRCRCNAVNLLPNPHNRHSIARPWGRVMDCLLLLWYLIHFLPLLSECRINIVRN